MAVDPRLDPKRDTPPARRVVAAPVAPLRREPRPDAALDTQALMGEAVDAYEATEAGWCWVQLCGDGYVGWMPADALAAPGMQATHRVASLRTLVFPGPSIKLPPVASLPFGATLGIERMEGALAVTPLGFVPARHLAPLGTSESDWVAVAERFLGTPYLWGGRSADGIDCSGLVQVALAACGIAGPRDSDMQEAEVGEAVEVASLRRGDLIFWKGHVALARDAATLVHANAFHMAVAVEPVAEAFARIRAAGSEVTSVRRINPARGRAGDRR